MTPEPPSGPETLHYFHINYSVIIFWLVRDGESAAVTMAQVQRGLLVFCDLTCMTVSGDLEVHTVSAPCLLG